MPRVQVFNWNPRRGLTTGPVGRRIRLGPRVNNFGDMLGPLIVSRMRKRLGLPESAARKVQLVTVGSVLHLADRGAVVWGSGINGKVPADAVRNLDLDVRAVRGPLTAAILESHGYMNPHVFGDPGLLVGGLLPELTKVAKVREIGVVPNLNDRLVSGPYEVLEPTRPLNEALEFIAASEFVVGSSLHGVIVAESLGIPARLVKSDHEADFKYDDYYQGTERTLPPWCETVAEAVSAGAASLLAWNPRRLLAAFPRDLWAEPR